jgi:hypothetical protein
MDGLLALTATGSGVVEVPSATTPSLANIDAMIAAIPVDVADRDDLTLFMSVPSSVLMLLIYVQLTILLRP